MKRTVLALGIFALTAAALFCDTMMVAVFDRQEKGAPNQTKNSLAYAVESGVMEHLFDEGHIVFNAGPRGDDSIYSGSATDETVPLYMAKSGGAGFLLNIYVAYVDAGTDESKWEVSSAEYQLMNVYSNEVLTEGSMEMRSPSSNEKSVEEQSFAFGRRLAQEALADRKAAVQ